MGTFCVPFLNRWCVLLTTEQFSSHVNLAIRHLLWKHTPICSHAMCWALLGFQCYVSWSEYLVNSGTVWSVLSRLTVWTSIPLTCAVFVRTRVSNVCLKRGEFLNDTPLVKRWQVILQSTKNIPIADMLLKENFVTIADSFFHLSLVDTQVAINHTMIGWFGYSSCCSNFNQLNCPFPFLFNMEVLSEWTVYFFF